MIYVYKMQQAVLVWLICTLKIVVLTMLVCTAVLAEDQTQEKRAKQSALTLIYKILNDSMLPEDLHGAKLVFQGKNAELNTLEYDVAKLHPTPAFNKVSISVRDNGGFDFMIFLENEDAIEVSQELDWEESAKQCDAFVARYWPELERITNWRESMSRYKSRGTFNVEYALKEKEVAIMSLGLDIRLADGKIGGLNLLDRRSLLKGVSIPSLPSQEKILSVAYDALEEQKLGIPKDVAHLRLVRMTRGVKVEQDDKKKQKLKGFILSLKLHGEKKDGQPVGIIMWYDETTDKAGVSGSYNPTEMEPTSTSKPFTTVIDEVPVWGEDSRHLFFTTTRDVQGRLWWQRDSILLSIASEAVSEERTHSLTLVRPIKPKGHDFTGYRYAVPSPTGKYLAAQEASANQFFCLDVERGVFYLPELDVSAQAQWRSSNEITPPMLPLQLQAKGMAWLPDENGLIVAWEHRDRDPNLYLARWKQGQTPQNIELVPVVFEPGYDVRPELSADGKTLAWAHKVDKPEREKQPGEKDQWQLLLADFDVTSLTTQPPRLEPGQVIDVLPAIARQNTRNRRTLDLPDEPLSIAWDEKNNRWLVVTLSKMLWVSERDGKFEMSEAPALYWNGLSLHTTSADVSRKGQIALAAELEKPQVYEKTECVVHSLIFLWDGQSTTVKPACEPSLNGIECYIFPATGSPWARTADKAAIAAQKR